MSLHRRNSLTAVAFLLLAAAVAAACDGSPAAPSPAAGTPTAPAAPSAGPSTPAPTPPPASTPVNPGAVEVQVPAFPGAQPTSGIEGEPRTVTEGVDPNDYTTIYEAQYQTTAAPDDVIAFYRVAMAFSPYGWEKFDILGAGLLFRSVFTKQDARYVAWVMTFTAPGGTTPTWVLIEVAEKTGPGGSGQGAAAPRSLNPS